MAEEPTSAAAAADTGVRSVPNADGVAGAPRGTGAAGDPDHSAGHDAEGDPAYVLDHTVQTITGEQQTLDTYRGQVVVIVNVASRCGFTRQYAGLEAMYRELGDRGLVVLGFPSNDFGGQEPGTDAEIAAFCESRFDVTFPMFSKVPVKGSSATPLYRDLAGQAGSVGGEPRWNFTKWVVDREGRAVARFDSGTEPDDAAFRATIERLLDEA